MLTLKMDDLDDDARMIVQNVCFKMLKRQKEEWRWRQRRSSMLEALVGGSMGGRGRVVLGQRGREEQCGGEGCVRAIQSEARPRITPRSNPGHLFLLHPTLQNPPSSNTPLSLSPLLFFKIGLFFIF